MPPIVQDEMLSNCTVPSDWQLPDDLLSDWSLLGDLVIRLVAIGRLAVRLVAVGRAAVRLVAVGRAAIRVVTTGWWDTVTVQLYLMLGRRETSAGFPWLCASRVCRQVPRRNRAAVKKGGKRSDSVKPKKLFDSQRCPSGIRFCRCCHTS